MLCLKKQGRSFICKQTGHTHAQCTNKEENLKQPKPKATHQIEMRSISVNVLHHPNTCLDFNFNSI
eukprot:c44138_g1_i1 orf=23-220(+)